VESSEIHRHGRMGMLELRMLSFTLGQDLLQHMKMNGEDSDISVIHTVFLSLSSESVVPLGMPLICGTHPCKQRGPAVSK
jgi:hypothetical protein